MQLTYKYRLYPSPEQEAQIRKTCDCARYVYNKLLEERTKHYRQTGKWNKLDRRFLGRLPFIDGIDEGALNFAQSSLETAFRNFFRTERTKTHKYRPDRILAAEEDPSYKLMDTDLVSYPKFKKKKSSKQSYSTPLPDFAVLQGKVVLPCVGSVKIRYHRSLPENAEVISGTVLKKPSGNYFLLIKLTLKETPPKKELSVPLGVALAPGQLAVRSDAAPVYYRHTSPELLKRINRAYKTLKRRSPGSKRYEKQRKYLASLYEHRANQRRDDLHKAARQIVNAADTVYMQKPNVSEQLQNLPYPEDRAAFLDEAPWTFSQFVQYKAKLVGSRFWSVPKEGFVYSICSRCYAHKKKDWKGVWICPQCGARLGLYENAAANLQNLAQEYILQQST